MCKKIRKQLESATCNKGQCQLLYSLNLICEKPQEGESSNWMIIINRGGLLHIKNSTYLFFEAMEKVVQRTLCKESQKIDKEAVIKCIVEDTEVALLDIIIKLWITIRGFSYANANCTSKRQLQRAKALGKVV